PSRRSPPERATIRSFRRGRCGGPRVWSAPRAARRSPRPAGGRSGAVRSRPAARTPRTPQPTPTGWDPGRTAVRRSAPRPAPVGEPRQRRPRRRAPRRTTSSPAFAAQPVELALDGLQQLFPGPHELVDALALQGLDDLGVAHTDALQVVEDLLRLGIRAGHRVGRDL